MSETRKETFLTEKASALFSGGTDSTLAAYLLTKIARKVTLLTFDPGFIFFVENSKRHADKLARAVGKDRILHEIIPINPFIKELLFGEKKKDFKKYGFNLTALVCLGCRLSMHAAGIIYNLKNQIPVIVDGSIRKQSTIPEQLSSFIHRNRQELWSRYHIRHYSPIYNEDHSDLRLDEIGLSLQQNLKRQFIFFDTQPTCPFGVPADVYARIFYGSLSGHAREVDAYQYARQKYPILHQVIERHFADEGLDMEAMKKGLEPLFAEMPEQWPGD